MIDTELSSIFKSCADAIRSKTGDISATYTPYELSTGIGNIETNLQPIQDEWYLPAGWIDLRDVLKNDPFKNRTNVVGRMALLIQVDQDDFVPVRAVVNNVTYWQHIQLYYCANSIGLRTSNDPDTFVTEMKNYAPEWDKSKFIVNPYNGEKYIWIEIYYKSDVCHIWGDSIPVYMPTTRWVCGDGNSKITIQARFVRLLEAITNFTQLNIVNSYLFECCALKTVPEIYASPSLNSMTYIFDNTSVKYLNFKQGGIPLSCTSYAGFASSCYNLKEVPDLLFEGNKVTNVNNMFSNCPQITKYPDVMDFSNVTTNKAQFWNYCNFLRQRIEKLPSKMIFPNVVSCQINQMGTIRWDTIARFDDENNLSGGWLYGWEKHPDATSLSVKFQTSISGWMTTDQVESVVNHLESKGIYLYKL